MTESIRWQVRLEPQASLAHLETRIELQPGERFSLPAWIPGSYLVREFVRGVQDLHLESAAGAPLRVHKTRKDEWEVDLDQAQECVLRYSVYGRELTVRTAHIDSTHAFFNGANAFMRFHGREHLPQDISVQTPDDWGAFISLPVVEGNYRADNFIHLADTVFEFGPHRVHSFEIDSIPHRFIFWGADNLPIDIAKLEEDTIALVRQNMKTVGAHLPYERYDFIFHITPNGRGGLEHRDSTTLAVSWDSFETADGYLDMLTLIAHEHFHAWNGRRMTPVSLANPDFQTENYVDELWVVEGFTSYFDELNTLLAGRMTRQQWLERQAASLNAMERVFGRTRQSLTESSFDAWIRLYRPYEHTRNQTVSYYLKGALVALAIDLRIREASNGEKDLRHVTQELWRHWETTQSGYTTEEVLDIIRSIGGDDVAQDAHVWVTTTTPPPFERLFATQGITLGRAEKPGNDVGFDIAQEQGSAVVSSVNEARKQDVGSLMPGDEIIAIDGRRVRGPEFKNRVMNLVRAKSPSTVRFLVFRMGRQLEVDVTLSTAHDWALRFSDELTAGAGIRWLSE